METHPHSHTHTLFYVSYTHTHTHTLSLSLTHSQTHTCVVLSWIHPLNTHICLQKKTTSQANITQALRWWLRVYTHTYTHRHTHTHTHKWLNKKTNRGEHNVYIHTLTSHGHEMILFHQCLLICLSVCLTPGGAEIPSLFGYRGQYSKKTSSWNNSIQFNFIYIALNHWYSLEKYLWHPLTLAPKRARKKKEGRNLEEARRVRDPLYRDGQECNGCHNWHTYIHTYIQAKHFKLVMGWRPVNHKESPGIQSQSPQHT